MFSLRGQESLGETTIEQAYDRRFCVNGPFFSLLANLKTGV